MLTDLRFLWSSLINFRQQTLELRAMAHKLVIHTVSFIKQRVNVGYSLNTTRK